MLRFCLSILFVLGWCAANSQTQSSMIDSPDSNDTMQVVVMPDIMIFPKVRFQNTKEEQQYLKLIRDVKKTLPYAKLVYVTLIETYEYIQTIPDEKSRQEHLKRMEKELFEEYKPVLKKMSMSQGRLLLKLIDRECNQSSYSLVKAFLGSFRANFWNLFAGLFGASLKTEYDPQGKDAAIERVVLLVESGML